MDPISIQPTEQSNSKIWLIVTIVIVLIVIAFGLYFWRNAILPSSNKSADEINTLKQQGTSDNVASIEKDLQATDLNSLDKEVPVIDAELGTPAVK